MSERADVYAYFWVQGYECQHEVISSQLKLTPTSVQSVGDLKKHGPPAKFNSWEFLSPLTRGENLLQEYLESLLQVLEPNAEAVREIAARYSAGINCVGYYFGSNPGLHLSASLLARLSALQVAVDFDLYNYSESESN
jgi:hypothetical protein